MRQFAAVIVLAIAACLPISTQPIAAPIMTSVTVDAGLTTVTVKGTGFGTSGAVLTLGGVGTLTGQAAVRAPPAILLSAMAASARSAPSLAGASANLT
jgi:hypothetical protein